MLESGEISIHCILDLHSTGRVVEVPLIKSKAVILFPIGDMRICESSFVNKIFPAL